MAYHLSLDEPEATSSQVGFDEFCAEHVDQLGRAVMLAVPQQTRANKGFSRALAAASVQWSSLPEDRESWIFVQAVRNTGKQRDAGSPLYANDIATTVDSLPLAQRMVLVAVHYLGWEPGRLAIALDEPSDTVVSRYRWARQFIARAARVDDADLDLLLDEHLATQARMLSAPHADPLSLQRAGRRRVLRTRALASAAGIFAIAVVASLFAVDRPTPEQASGPAPVPTVQPPQTSSGSFGPVPDGTGGFVALNTDRGARFSRSTDGNEWYRESVWNQRAIDIRSEVTGFVKSGGRYIAMVEVTGSRSDFVAPRVAVSSDLDDWQVLDVEIEEPLTADGLVPAARVVAVAATSDHVLTIVRVEQQVDYRSFGLQADDVCVVSQQGPVMALHVCDGRTVPVETVAPVDGTRIDGSNRLFVSTAGGPFVGVDAPTGVDPVRLFSTDDRFVLHDPASGKLVSSTDGLRWEPFFVTDADNRFGLAAGSAGSGALIVEPEVGSWRTHLVEDDRISEGLLPMDLDPESVWLKPQIASGPAGWAVFVTASRPWERQNDEHPGWAVRSDSWVVSSIPGTATISAQSLDGATSYRFAPSGRAAPASAEHGSIERSLFGAVRLFDPATGVLLAEVTEEQIRASRGLTTSSSLAGLFEIDDWQLSGNLTDGPLTVRSPAGDQQVFSDGFAFFNDSLADGVEIVTADDVQSLVIADKAGEPGITIELQAIRAAFASTGVPADSAATQTQGSVLYSADGVMWETIWTTDNDTWYGTIAVGDEEVLLTSAQLTGGPIRIPIDN